MCDGGSGDVRGERGERKEKGEVVVAMGADHGLMFCTDVVADLVELVFGFWEVLEKED